MAMEEEQTPAWLYATEEKSISSQQPELVFYRHVK